MIQLHSKALAENERCRTPPAPVWLLDDDPSVLKATGRLLRAAGWGVKTFTDPTGLPARGAAGAASGGGARYSHAGHEWTGGADAPSPYRSLHPCHCLEQQGRSRRAREGNGRRRLRLLPEIGGQRRISEWRSRRPCRNLKRWLRLRPPTTSWRSGRDPRRSARYCRSHTARCSREPAARFALLPEWRATRQ